MPAPRSRDELEKFVRVAFVLVAAFLATGCVSQEGVMTYSYDLGVEEILEAREQLGEENVPTDLVVVGTISLLRQITEENVDEIYSEYSSFAESVHPNEPALYDRNSFLDQFSGWSRVKTFAIPMVYADYEFVLVPRSFSDQIGLPTRIGTFAAQESGDLVASRTNSDGYYVVARILCADKTPAAECGNKYHKGYFDGRTGIEIDPDTLTPKVTDKRIDPSTFERVATSRSR